MNQGIEWQVSSLEPSKRLRKLGVPQMSLFFWDEVIDEHSCAPKVFYTKLNTPPKDRSGVYKATDGTKWKEKYYSALTVAEIGEIFKRIGAASEDHIKYYITEKCDKTTSYIDLLSADFWAEMLIYLIENGLVDVKLLGNKEIC